MVCHATKESADANVAFRQALQNNSKFAITLLSDTNTASQHRKHSSTTTPRKASALGLPKARVEQAVAGKKKSMTTKRQRKGKSVSAVQGEAKPPGQSGSSTSVSLVNPSLVAPSAAATVRKGKGRSMTMTGSGPSGPATTKAYPDTVVSKVDYSSGSMASVDCSLGFDVPDGPCAIIPGGPFMLDEDFNPVFATTQAMRDYPEDEVSELGTFEGCTAECCQPIRVSYEAIPREMSEWYTGGYCEPIRDSLEDEAIAREMFERYTGGYCEPAQATASAIA